MDHILKKLYCGAIHPNENFENCSKELSKKEAQAIRSYDSLIKKLPEELKKECMKMIDDHCALLSLDMEQNFIDGFCLGAQLISEVFNHTP